VEGEKTKEGVCSIKMEIRMRNDLLVKSIEERARSEGASALTQKNNKGLDKSVY